MSRLQFFEDGHRYLLDGRPILSNTQLLKAERLIDYEFYDIAGRERGSRVHAACWLLDEGILDWNTVREEEKGYLHAFERFKKETEWKTDFNELPVWGTPGFGTRLDLLGVGFLNGTDNRFPGFGVFSRRRAVIDIKSGDAPEWVGLQTGGQVAAINERIQAGDETWTQHLEYVNGHPYPELRFALCLKKDGDYRLKPFNDPTEPEVFRSLVGINNWKASHGYFKKAA